MSNQTEADLVAKHGPIVETTTWAYIMRSDYVKLPLVAVQFGRRLKHRNPRISAEWPAPWIMSNIVDRTESTSDPEAVDRLYALPQYCTAKQAMAALAKAKR